MLRLSEAWSLDLLDPWILTPPPNGTDEYRESYAARMAKMYDDRILSIRRQVQFLTRVYWFAVIVLWGWVIARAGSVLLTLSWGRLALLGLFATVMALLPYWIWFVEIGVTLFVLGLVNVARQVAAPNWIH